MSVGNGYAGKVLWVDLATGKTHTVPTEVYSERFLGGRGLAAKIYWDEVPPGVDAFNPENRVIFATGPVTATTGFAGSRWQVCGKSPIHNLFSYCNLGGGWGAQLKGAGYDALVVHGRAEKPVYLWVGEKGLEMRDAVGLMGKGAITCREALKEELGKNVGVVAIGPAGENRVVFSTLLADSDSSGSSGLASVLGSKNLKAIVVQGNRKVDVADPDRVKVLRERIRQMKSRLPSDTGSVVPKERLKSQVCHGCWGGCIRKTYTSRSGKTGKFMCDSAVFYLARSQRFYGEFNDVPFEANKLIDDYGLDSYSTETMIMWLLRCAKEGILTEEQTGLPFSKIGSLEFIEALVRMISHREGFGDLLALGTLKAAEVIGRNAQALITDYLSSTGYLPVYGGRMFITNGLFWAMEPRLPIQQLHEMCRLVMRWAFNAQGLQQNGVTSAVVRAIAKRFWGSEIAADFSTYEGKALAGVKIQDRQYAMESLILCDFAWPIHYTETTSDGVGDPTLESQLCEAVTGQRIDEEGLYKVGARVFNLQRAILTREGRKGREQDCLEEFNFTEPLKWDFGNPNCLVPGKNGETFSRKGMVVDRDQFEKMKDEYYGIRGWDVQTGLQKRTALEKLDLVEVADNLERTMHLGG